MRSLVIALLLLMMEGTAMAAENIEFDSIEGGTIDLSNWEGRPVLVVNTASRCGFTPQYKGLQELQDTYRDSGLLVLAVPSDDFNQELDDAEAVKDFCEITFGLDLPMTDITPVTGPAAHGFYQSVKERTGFVPRWNFNKILIGKDGSVLGTWGATTRPTGRPIIRAIERALAGS